MTYTTSNPPRIETWSSDGAKPTTWTYASEHTMRDIAETAFFTDATNLGMRVGDIIFAQQNVEPFDSATFTVFDITDGEATLSRSRVSPFLETDGFEGNLVRIAANGDFEPAEIVFEEQTLDADLIRETLAYYTGVDAINWPDGSQGWAGQAVKIASGAEEGNIGIIALDTLNGRIATRVKNSVWGDWTYIEKEISVEDFGAVSYLTKALASVGEDCGPAVQAAVNYCVNNNISAKIRFGPNAFRLSSTVVVPKSSMGFVGAGMLETAVYVDENADAGFWCTRDNMMFEDMGILASTARSAVAFASSGTMCGIRLEPEDAVDTTALRSRYLYLRNIQVFGHPNHGIVGVGAVSGIFLNCDISGNKGHGYAIAKDIYPRVHAAGVPGLCIIMGGKAINNGGHGVCTAPLTDTSSPAVRINLINMEFENNATDAAVRLWPSELYLRGAEIVVDTCIMTPADTNTTIEGIYASGVSIRLINNRYITCTRIGTIASHALLQTKNVVIDGAQMISGPAAYNPLVQTRIEVGASEPFYFRPINYSGGVVTKLLATDGSYTPSPQTQAGLLRMIGGRLVFHKLTNQTVNNSVTMADCAGLEMAIEPNENVFFMAVIRYTAEAAADIRLRLIGPAGSTTDFSTPDGLKYGTGDTAIVSPVTGSASQLTAGAAPSSERMITLVGTCLNGSTAGRLRVQFAQVVADVSDCIVYAASVIHFASIDN